MGLWLPNYQTYYAVNIDDHIETWGGRNYTKILVTDYPDSNLNCTASTDALSGGVPVAIDFLYPQLVQSTYYLDGMAKGIVTYKGGSTSGTHTITGVTVGLYKLNDDTTETLLGSSTSPTLSRSVTGGATPTYQTFPFYIPLDKQRVDAYEKLLFRATVITAVTSANSIMLSHANDSSVPDIKIEIPFAPTG